MTTVSVLIAVYNGEQYICQAIDSIFGQTFTDFELILIEDGSTDNSRAIITDYARKDSRVVLIENECNKGLIYSLNQGLKVAQGKYIARMDADDISLPNRIALQVGYLEQHPEVGVLGTNIIYIDANGRIMYEGHLKDSKPISPHVIRWMLHWRCPIYHPTVMLRRAVLEHTGFTYDSNFRHAEDYELWTRLNKYTIIASLPEALVHYRILSTSVCRVFKKEQQILLNSIARRELTTLLGIATSTEALETLIGVFTKCNNDTSCDFVAASDVLFEAYWRFCQQPLSAADQEQIKADVAERLISIAQEASKYSLKRAFFILWKLWRLSLLHVFSLKTARRTLRIILNSFTG